MAQSPQRRKSKEMELTWEYEEFKYPDQKLKAVKNIEQFRDRFTIDSLLGGGGDGDVYTVKGKKWAAVKKIILDEDEDEEYELMRARQEQRLLAKANIANIYGIYFEEREDKNGRYHRYIYKVYDRYDYALDAIIFQMKEVRPSEQQIKHIIYDICKDIAKLHRQGFMHLDIKPSNILYCKHGTYKKRGKDAASFKLIDYDGCIWNHSVDETGKQHQGEGVELPWQGTFCWTAPEMNDYVEETNLVSFSADIWQIGLVILFLIHNGHLGLLDVTDEENDRFYQNYDTLDAVAIKGEIFDEWYDGVFGAQKLYEKEIERLYKRHRISKDLYELLSNGIFIRDPLERYSIEEVLEHPWFDKVDKSYVEIKIGDKIWDYYDALMYKDEGGHRVHNGRIRWMQRQEIPSDDEGSCNESEDEKGNDYSSESDEDDEGEIDDEEEEKEKEIVDKKVDEESPEIRFYSDKDSEEEPTISRYNSSDYCAHNSHSGSSVESDDDARFNLNRLKPINRRIKRRMSM